VAFGIGVEETSDHSLILCVVFPRFAFEEFNATLAQGNGDLDALLLEDEVLGRRKEIRNDLELPEWLIRVFDSRAHRLAFLLASSPPRRFV